MDFFNLLLSWLTKKETKRKNNKNNHYIILRQLQRNHEWVDVIVPKTEKSHQSLILKIDPDNHELLIDELYPSENTEKLEAGDTIEIISKLRKTPINFYTRMLAREFIDGKTALRVELPEQIGHNHSRQAYRVFVSNEVNLAIEIQYEGNYLEDVRIINLSSEGIKLSVADSHCEQFEKKTSLNDCIIRLPNGFEIDCDIELRNVYQIRTPQPHTLAGGILVIKQVQQRVQLEQYLAAIQRQQRRRESRLL